MSRCPQNPPLATAYRFESGHRHQSNIIRTRFSPWEMGSDYLFISPVTSKPILLTAGRYGPNPNPVAHERRSPNKQREQPRLGAPEEMRSFLLPFCLKPATGTFLNGRTIAAHPVAVPGIFVGDKHLLICRPLPLAHLALSAAGSARIAPRENR